MKQFKSILKNQQYIIVRYLKNAKLNFHGEVFKNTAMTAITLELLGKNLLCRAT